MDDGQDTVSEQEHSRPPHAEVAMPHADAGAMDLDEDDSGSEMDVDGGGRTPPMGSPRPAVQQQQQQQTPKARVAAGPALTPGRAADPGQEVRIMTTWHIHDDLACTIWKVALCSGLAR